MKLAITLPQKLDESTHQSHNQPIQDLINVDDVDELLDGLVECSPSSKKYILNVKYVHKGNKKD